MSPQFYKTSQELAEQRAQELANRVPARIKYEAALERCANAWDKLFAFYAPVQEPATTRVGDETAKTRAKAVRLRSPTAAKPREPAKTKELAQCRARWIAARKNLARCRKKLEAPSMKWRAQPDDADEE